ncbi:CBS domain-containing protein [Sediminitomix flava]|uniref:CBS domain protein n=1 Tax=Sediminitomix flava TaxID=379075 RepID=A0A315ZFZ8_SEDFL|nr:CBS domain-containing protein [Sediminitomix flava]PWJ44083.1 CBS domain protein [Sediminitomix flava]
MYAKEYISSEIPVVKMSDPIERIYEWMEELQLDQLPVVEGNKFLGVITEECLLDLDLSQGVNSGKHALQHQKAFIYQYDHFYRILDIAGEHSVELVAVLNAEDEYIGCISLRDTVASLSDMFASQVEGSILVLKVDAINYSLAEISRHIETNNARILSSFVEVGEDKNSLQLTLKLNTKDLTSIIATLERFQYKIVAKFQDEETIDTSKDRIGLLLKYLDI